MWDKLVELDIFNADKKIGLKNATPAQISTEDPNQIPGR